MTSGRQQTVDTDQTPQRGTNRSQQTVWTQITRCKIWKTSLSIVYIQIRCRRMEQTDLSEQYGPRSDAAEWDVPVNNANPDQTPQNGTDKSQRCKSRSDAAESGCQVSANSVDLNQTQIRRRIMGQTGVSKQRGPGPDAAEWNRQVQQRRYPRMG